MIYFLTADEKLNKILRKKLKDLAVAHQFINMDKLNQLDSIYKNEKEITALVADSRVSVMPDRMWVDVLSSFSKRLPTLVLLDDNDKDFMTQIDHNFLLSSTQNATAVDILKFLDSCGALSNTGKPLFKEAIPLYNPILSTHLLQQDGSLSILSVQAHDISKLALEYGADVYHQLQLCLQKVLFELWGASGSFRSADMLCRRTPNGDTFYILLERSRSDASIPMPGDLEKLADRITLRLQNLLWREIFDNSKERILPKFLDFLPKFSVGYATVLNNPCVLKTDLIDSLFETCKESSRLQLKRMLKRQTELVQTLIQTEGVLQAHFQAVFEIAHLDLADIPRLKNESVFKVFPDCLNSFESLIRVNKDVLRRFIGQDEIGIDFQFLNPKVLFELAGSADLLLELDQACFRCATRDSKELPYRLMVNILPRNFYFIDHLKHLIPDDANLIFEVSETEAINNMSLLQKAREELGESRFGVAIDDFGRGYAGVDRIIQIKPNVLKIDQSLIENIHLEDQKRAFVKGIVDAGKSNNSVILAEGVETIDELRVVQELGVDLVQGFLLHRPQDHVSLGRELQDSKAQNTLKTVA